MVFIFMSGCDNGAQPGDTTPTQAHGAPAHQVTPEIEKKVIDDATDDLKIIAASGKDAAGLARALTGKALEEARTTLTNDLAQGKYRQRDYQGIQVRVQDVTGTVAGVSAEFDDNGFYVDAGTGAALTDPTREHKKYALAMVEEDGRWKIKSIFSASATTTTSTDTTSP